MKTKSNVLFPLFFLFALSTAFALPEKANTSSKSEKIVFASTDDNRAFLSAAKRGDCSEVERLLKAAFFRMCTAYFRLYPVVAQNSSMVSSFLFSRQGSTFSPFPL